MDSLTITIIKIAIKTDSTLITLLANISSSLINWQNEKPISFFKNLKISIVSIMANTHKVKDVWIFHGRSNLLIFITLTLEFLNGNILSL